MKPAVCLVLLVACALLSFGMQAQPVTPYTLTYNAADGTLVIDTLGNPLYTYSVKSSGAFGGNDGFFEANHALLPDAPGGTNTPANTSTDDELSQSDSDGWLNQPPFSLGSVLSAGLNEAQFLNELDTSIQNTFYVDELGTLNNPQTFKAFDIVYNVPEPSSMLLLGLGGVLLVQQRRTR
ncbi:MAG: PEP-CTERM sorting domain-containing protein [Planctomycetota bacterium]